MPGRMTSTMRWLTMFPPWPGMLPGSAPRPDPPLWYYRNRHFSNQTIR
jgi:hypothetical protein